MRSSHGAIDRYISELRRALARNFVFGHRIVAEVRDHLVDSAERQEQQGMSGNDADAAAIAAFGPPDAVAAAMAHDGSLALYRVAIITAVAFGAAIAWVDSRPGWDDTGVTAAALVAVALVLGAVAPRRATTLGILVGAGIPACAIVRAPSWSALAMCVVLLFPLAGAWLGRGARQLLHASIS